MPFNPFAQTDPQPTPVPQGREDAPVEAMPDDDWDSLWNGGQGDGSARHEAEDEDTPSSDTPAETHIDASVTDDSKDPSDDQQTSRGDDDTDDWDSLWAGRPTPEQPPEAEATDDRPEEKPEPDAGEGEPDWEDAAWWPDETDEDESDDSEPASATPTASWMDAIASDQDSGLQLDWGEPEDDAPAEPASQTSRPSPQVRGEPDSTPTADEHQDPFADFHADQDDEPDRPRTGGRHIILIMLAVIVTLALAAGVTLTVVHAHRQAEADRQACRTLTDTTRRLASVNADLKALSVTVSTPADCTDAAADTTATHDAEQTLARSRLSLTMLIHARQTTLAMRRDTIVHETPKASKGTLSTLQALDPWHADTPKQLTAMASRLDTLGDKAVKEHEEQDAKDKAEAKRKAQEEAQRKAEEAKKAAQAEAQRKAQQQQQQQRQSTPRYQYTYTPRRSTPSTPSIPSTPKQTTPKPDPGNADATL